MSPFPFQEATHTAFRKKMLRGNLRRGCSGRKQACEEAMINKQKIVEERTDTCGSLLRNRHSVVITSESVVLLPTMFWINAEVRCGDFTEVLETRKSSQVFCWSCARDKGMVVQSEEEYSKEEVRHQDCKLRW